MKETTFIYALTDPRTNEVRYIGKSDNPQHRYRNHTSSHHESKRKTNWVRKLRRLGLRPGILILEEVPILQWQERECYWIAYYREHGANLVNMNEGGTGLTELTPEHRKKISESGKGKKRSPETVERCIIAARERANDPEWLAKMDEILKNRTLGPEWRESVAQAKREYVKTPEGKAQLERMLQSTPRSHSPATRAKMSASHRRRIENGYTPSPEVRAKISEAKKDKPRSPETIAKMSAANTGKKRGPMSEEQKANIAAAKRGKPNPKLSETKKGKPTNNPRCKTCGTFLKGNGQCSRCSA